jgi:hypothetical protein
MTEIVNTILQNEKLVTLIFSGVVALSTVVYAFLTWRLSAETIKMRKAHTEPNVSIYLEQNRASIHFFDLIVKNIGSSPAYDVVFKVLEEFEIQKERKLSQIDFIQEGIRYMPPNYSIRCYFLNFLENYEKIIDKNIKIQVTYKNANKEKLLEIINLNMSQFKGIQTLGEDPINKIAKSIESIQKDVGTIASGHRHLRVDTYDSEDREKIKAEYEEQRAESLKKQQNNKKDRSAT